MTEQTQKRVGILADRFDPVAQLMAESHELSDCIIGRITDPVNDIPLFDEVIVTSQRLFLAAAGAIGLHRKPCRVVLRRSNATADIREWENAISLFAAASGALNSEQIEILALNDGARDELATLTGLYLRTIEQLPIPAGLRHFAIIDFATGLIAHNTEAPTTQELDAVNWVRLRKRAMLVAAPNSCPDIEDLVEYANGHVGTEPQDAAPNPPRYLCIVPNGVGLGHLTRLLAVADELAQRADAEVVFWCFSRGAGIIEAAGYPVILRQTAQHLGADTDDWRVWETVALRTYLRGFKPTAVIYDGSIIDASIPEALHEPGTGAPALIWIRRGMWQPTSDVESLNVTQYCDLILEPGELAGEVDRGPTGFYRPRHLGLSNLVSTPPIVQTTAADLQKRARARRRLKIGSGRTCLVSLGGDIFVNRALLVSQLVECAAKVRVNLVWAQSPLAHVPFQHEDGLEIRQIYPLGPYLPAFDGIISASGYNSFHELMLLTDAPVLFAPVMHERLDDQVGRAKFGAERGWCDALLPESQEFHLVKIMSFMNKIRARKPAQGRPGFDTGAAMAAQAILDVDRVDPEVAE